MAEGLCHGSLTNSLRQTALKKGGGKELSGTLIGQKQIGQGRRK
ncbi:hypothetical protein T02_2012 [Trichinella nativa]|uniref:Uncharacterized protein n=1 Tax=Trichinella nativa TaxID=6335 RepID=A0A0V1KHQ8_9BILA|nr:hypothetical protein T02_2012 [Trichinella nativa]